MKTKQIITLAICLLTLIGIFQSAPALAARSTVTIESQTNSAFDYLEYYSNGSWHDLNTPRHWIEQTGEVVYCVEHSAGNPHGQTYTETSPSSVFSGSTLAGINSMAIPTINPPASRMTKHGRQQQMRCASGFRNRAKAIRTTLPIAVPTPTQ